MFKLARRLYCRALGQFLADVCRAGGARHDRGGCGGGFHPRYNVQSKMQSDLDSALLSAVGKVGTSDPADLKAEIVRIFKAQTDLGASFALSTDDIAIDTSTSQIVATVRAEIPSTFMVVAGVDKMPVLANVLGRGRHHRDQEFAVHVHGARSLGLDGREHQIDLFGHLLRQEGQALCLHQVFTKIESLKMAVADMLAQLVASDPDAEYVRTGAVSYNAAMQTPSPLNWGTLAASAYVSALTATGGTDSSLAFQTAYESIVAASENEAHHDVNGQVPVKYIVFMTDGDNNTTSADTIHQDLVRQGASCQDRGLLGRLHGAVSRPGPALLLRDEHRALFRGDRHRLAGCRLHQDRQTGLQEPDPADQLSGRKNARGGWQEPSAPFLHGSAHRAQTLIT